MAIQKATTRVSYSAAEKLLRDAGALRVSDTAKKEFVRTLEEMGLDLAQKAVRFANHANRITISDKDIKAAKK